MPQKLLLIAFLFSFVKQPECIACSFCCSVFQFHCSLIGDTAYTIKPANFLVRVSVLNNDSYNVRKSYLLKRLRIAEILKL